MPFTTIKGLFLTMGTIFNNKVTLMELTSRKSTLSSSQSLRNILISKSILLDSILRYSLKMFWIYLSLILTFSKMYILWNLDGFLFFFMSMSSTKLIFYLASSVTSTLTSSSYLISICSYLDFLRLDWLVCLLMMEEWN